MRNINVFAFFITIISISSTLLTAEEYNVNTNNKDLNCSITTLSEEEMSEILGPFSLEYLPITPEPEYNSANIINHNTNNFIEYTSQPETIDLFSEATKNYMAVKVSIKNNTQNTISLTRDAYFAMPNSCLILKEKIAHQLHSQLKDLLKGKAARIYGSGLAVSAIGTILTMIAVAISHNREDLHCALGLGGATFVSTLIFGLIARTKQTSYDYACLKEKEFLDNSFYQRSNKPAKKYFFMANETTLDVPPRSEFHDIIFVDLRKETRDIFDTITPTLIYNPL